MEKAQYEWILHMSILMSKKEGRRILVSEAIRMALEEAYPVPKNSQMNLFE
jgi:hypothetical protein